LLRASGPVAGYVGSVTSHVDNVLVVEEDTWSATGLAWNLATAHALALGAAASRLGR
jgi:hypothetical protein